MSLKLKFDLDCIGWQADISGGRFNRDLRSSESYARQALARILHRDELSREAYSFGGSSVARNEIFPPPLYPTLRLRNVY
jgi:hypothetical protein